MSSPINFSHRENGRQYTAHRFERSTSDDELAAFGTILRDSAAADGVKRPDLQDIETVAGKMRKNLDAESIESPTPPTRLYYAVKSSEGELVAAASIGARALDDYSSPTRIKLNGVRRQLGMVSAQVSNDAGEIKGLFEIGAVHKDNEKRLYLGLMAVHRAMVDVEFSLTVHHATEAEPPENLERRLAEVLALKPASVSGIRRGLEVRESTAGHIYNSSLFALTDDFIISS